MKLDIEAIELEDDRPRRPPRRRDDEEFDRVPEAQAAERTSERAYERPPARAYEAPRRTAPARDPFFDRPYEAAAQATPAWEASAKAGSGIAPGRGLTPNIRPKKKVASLLGGS
jgi:hypothetical protein